MANKTTQTVKVFILSKWWEEKIESMPYPWGISGKGELEMLRPGFELGLTFPFPTMITATQSREHVLAIHRFTYPRLQFSVVFWF